MKDSSKNIRIKKLKGSKNWTTWYDDTKSTLTLKNLWEYAAEDEIQFVASTKPTFTAESFIRSVDSAVQKKYDKDKMMYETDAKKCLKSHKKIMTIIKFICELDSRVHLISITNAHTVLDILRKLYEETNLSIIDISYKEISRFNLKNFSSIETYNEHLKKHREKIIQTNENVTEWQMSSAFRMSLSSRLNPYVFQLVHAAKNVEKELTIDEMMAALTTEEKKSWLWRK